MINLFRGIGRRIFLSFSSLLLALIVLFSYLALKYVEKTSIENAGNELRVLGVSLSERLTSQFKKFEGNLRNLAANQGYASQLLKNKNPRDYAKAQVTLKGKLTNLSYLKEISIFDLTGTCIASSSKEWVGLRAFREQFFYEGLKKLNYSDIYEVLTEISVSENNPESYLEQEKVLLLSTPIFSDSEVIGVLVTKVNLSAINELLDAQLGMQGSAETFLVDSKLRFITPSDKIPEESLESHLKKAPVSFHLAEEFWVGSYKNFHGEDVLGTASKLKDRNWYLVIERDLQTVRDKVAQLRSSLIGATILIALFLIVVTLILTQTITSPLIRLAQGAERVGGGDLESPFEVHEGKDEIAILSQQIEKMRKSLAEAQKLLKQRLEMSEQRRIQNDRLAAIGALASSLAHEIRNPLNGMNLLLSQLERQSHSTTDEQKVFQSMRSEIQRLDRLVNDILDYSRPLQLSLVTVDVVGLMEGLTDFFRATCVSKGVELVYKNPTEKFLLQADLDKLKQAFLNLLQNALDATLRGGRITVEIDRSKYGVQIVISDTGVGMDQQSQKRLFDLFYTTKKGGTGLGLSTVKKIIDAHLGDIYFSSEPAKGTRAFVQFPVLSQKQES